MYLKDSLEYKSIQLHVITHISFIQQNVQLPTTHICTSTIAFKVKL